MPITIPSGLSYYDGTRLLPVGIEHGIKAVIDAGGDWADAADDAGVTDRILAGYVSNPSRVLGLEDMAAIVASSTAMNEIVDSPDAVTALLASDTALQAVAASSTAMTAVKGSDAAVTEFLRSDRAMDAVGAGLWGIPFMSGFLAGIIDVTHGNIIGTDYFQDGQRHAVILGDISLENASLQYKTAQTAAPAQARTLWNGLGATAAMNSATYPAAQYCAGLTKPSGDAASEWYLPAMDELELVWRNLKPITNNNATDAYTGDFPPYAHASGDNPSSSPRGGPYTAAGAPFQTTVAAFKTGGAQAMANSYYWSATEYSSTNAWLQDFLTSGPGRQGNSAKGNGYRVRPVRRLVL